MLFLLVPGGFSDVEKENNYKSNWKKLLGFRNLQEKLENFMTLKNFINCTLCHIYSVSVAYQSILEQTQLYVYFLVGIAIAPFTIKS